MAITAAWTDPYDWQSADVITRTRINAMQSNIAFLKTPTSSRLTAQVTTNTTSTSLVDISLATITMTTNAAPVNVIFTGSFNISTAATALITLLIDGVNVGDATQGLQHMPATAATNAGISFTFPTATLTAASHTFKLQWKTSAGTFTLLAGWNFYVVERA